MDDMRWPQVCLISAACGGADSSVSGILIDNQRGIIISHASVLQPLLKNLPYLAGLIKSGKLFVEKNISELANVQLQITFERYKPGLAPSKRIQALTAEVCNNGNITTAGKVNANTDVDTETMSFEGTAKILFKATQFSEAVSKLFPPEENWKFADSAIPFDNSDKEKSREDNENVAKLLPLFLIIKLKKWHKLQMMPLVICSEKDIKRGSQVNVVGTPFGSLSPMVFFNSVSQGIIANTVRDASSEALSLILTDARCIPGCEGGALFLKDVRSENHQLAGVVAASLCWKANEWVGLSVVCPINELIRSLRKATQSSTDLTIALPPSLLSDSGSRMQGRCVTSAGPSSMQPVVVVHCGAMWGSGIVVDWREGIVLTCGHVVKRAADGYKVRVSLDGSIWRSSGADIVFVIKDQQVFDMALLRLQQPVYGRINVDKQPTIAPHKKLHQGEDVFVLGHGVFEDRYLPTWSMTSGIVSRVLRVNSVPVIVQSTCAVHPGASGGALVNKAGQLVGMVVCNAKDTVAGVCYPHVNLSIPAETIWPAIEHYCRTKDTKELEKLRIKNTIVEKLWALAPTDQIIGPKSTL